MSSAGWIAQSLHITPAVATAKDTCLLCTRRRCGGASVLRIVNVLVWHDTLALALAAKAGRRAWLLVSRARAVHDSD